MRLLAGKWLLVALFVAVPSAALAAVPGFYLGRSADLIDAVPTKTSLDAEAPTVEVKVTNQTGGEAVLYGWLNGEEAKARVPARSAIVTLTWRAFTEGRATLKLSLIANGAEDTEVHEVLLRQPSYGYAYTSSPSPTSSARTPTPSPSPSMRTVTPSPSPSPSELARTGDPIQSYVILGGGMLGFGLFVLGLAWVLGRRSAND